MIVREASELRFPPGVWPTDIKCPICGHNAHYTERISQEGEVQYVLYQCRNCEDMVKVFND